MPTFARCGIISLHWIWGALLIGLGGHSILIAQTAGRPPLILITVDTLRADHVSAVNSKSPVQTPAIDRLAGEGVTFLDTSTTNPLTTPAHASLLTGLWPPGHGVRDFTGYVLGLRHQTLAEVLSEAGYQTGAFVSAAVLDEQTGLGQGFDEYDDGSKKSFLGQDSRVAERSGIETLAAAQKWIAAHQGAPFFAWIHLYEPHDPYRPPARFAGAASTYAGEVAYVDELIGDFWKWLDERGLYSPSLITLLSDHGEGLGDHGESRHGYFVYQSTMWIPWILKLPSSPRPASRIDTPTSIVDVLPTLLAVLRVDRSSWPPEVQGQSRFGEILGSSTRTGDIYLESQTPRNQFGWSDLRAIRFGSLKYVEAPESELYDLARDPGEKQNLARSQSALANQLRESLRGFESRFQASSVDANSELDPELEERLRSLGYVGVAPATRPAAETGRVDPKQRLAVYEMMQKGVEAARERRWGDALSSLRQAAETEPDAPAILSSLALTSRDAGQLQESLQWFSRLQKLKPEDEFLRLETARTLLRAGQLEPAAALLSAILEKNPGNFQALFNLATLEAQKGDLKSAEALFERALKEREDSGVLRSLALAEALLGQLRESETHLLRALTLQPNDRTAHAQLADVYVRLGDRSKAAHHAAQAKKP